MAIGRQGNSENLPLFGDYPQLQGRLAHVSLGSFPTPVEQLVRISAEIGVDSLYIKRDDMSGQIYGGNKVRKLEFLLGDILRSKAKRVITLGFAGSNHALATAIYAGHLGLKSTAMLMPQVNARYVRQNLLADYYFNTRLLNYPNPSLLSLAVIGQLLRGLVRDGVFPRFIPAGGSCPLGIAGYVNAALELRDQGAAGMLPEPDRIYVAMGSMGTAAGLMLGLRAAGLKSRVIPVRVIEERLSPPRRMLRLINGAQSLLRKLDPSFPIVRLSRSDLCIRADCMGEGYACFTEKAVKAANLMKEKAGIPLNGTYSAKAFSALLDDAARGDLAGKVVLFWNTYNSRDFSSLAGSVDYRSLPKAFHRYFVEDVQPLDREVG